MEPSKELAEFLGIMVGDGNIYINRKLGIYECRVGLNATTEKEYALKFVLPSMQNLFNMKCAWRIAKGNEIIVRFYNKGIVFELKGLVNKTPNWIWSRNEFIKAYLRGLMDADGSVFSKTTNSSLPVIEFYQKDEEIMKVFVKGLEELNIKHSNIMKKKTTLCVGIYDKPEVEKYFSLIGFSNFKNVERYLSIKNARIV